MKNFLRQGFAKKAILFGLLVGLVSPSAFAFTDVGPVSLNPGSSQLVAAVAPQVNALGVSASTGSASVYFNLNTPSKTTVWIKDASDTIVKTLLFDTDLLANQTYQYTWNGTNNSGAAVASGSYKAQVVAYNAVDTAVQNYSFNFVASGGSTTTAPVVSVTASPTSFNPGNGEMTAVSYSLSQPASLGVNVLLNGSTIKTLRAQSSQSAGSFSVSWDGRSDSGVLMANNTYTIQVTATNTSGTDTKSAFVTITSSGGTTTTAPVISNMFANPSSFNPSTQNTAITYTLDKPATVTVSIMNGSTLVKTLTSGLSASTGANSSTWDGRNSSGTVVANGTYTAQVVATNSAGSNTMTASVQVASSTTGGTCSLVSSNFVNPSSFNPYNTDSQITYNLSQPATVSVRIKQDGNTVRSITSSESKNSGSNSVYWNGKNDSGFYSSNGSYVYEITASVSGCNPDVQTGYVYITGSSNTGNDNYIPDWISSDENLITNLYVNPEIFNPSNGERSTVTYYISHASKTLVQILNGSAVVKTLNDSRTSYQSAGNYTYTWDGRDNNGNRVSDGSYQVRVMADDGSDTDTDRASVQVNANGGFGTFPVGQRCAGFTDVSVNSPFCKAIMLMSAKDIFQGYPDGTFRPNTRINRAETAKVMVLALGFDVPSASVFGRLYNDTASNAWYSPFLDSAKRNGIATGYPDGSFRPANTINRVELLRMFLEGNNIRPSTCSPQPFDDTPINASTNWYIKYACYAKTESLMGSDTSSKLFPADDMTRGDVASLFYDFQVKGLYTNANSVFYNNGNVNNTLNGNNSCYTNSNGVYTCNNNVNNNNNSCYYNTNGVYTCNNTVNGNNSCYYNSNGTYTCGTYNSCFYNSNGTYTCNNGSNNTCIYNTNGTSNCSASNSNCYYNANGTVNCPNGNNVNTACSAYDYNCLNGYNYNTNVNNGNGYYVYQNGRYVWVTY